MKTKILFLLLFASFYASGQIVNIPDPVLKNALLGNNPNAVIEAYNSSNQQIQINANDDGEIQLSEALQVERLYISAINVAALNITSIDGLSSFDNIKVVSINHFKLSSINLTNGFTKLEEFLFSQNASPLTSVTVANLPKIKSLFIETLSSFSLSLTNLPSFYNITASKVSSVTFNNLPELRAVMITTSVVLNTIDFTAFSNLQSVSVNGLGVKHVNCSNLNLLQTLHIEDNNNTASESINALNLPNLEFLDCGGVNLQNLQIGTMPKLKTLWLINYHLETLDLSGSPLLDVLHIALPVATFINLKNGKTTYSQLSLIDLDNVETYICIDEDEVFPASVLGTINGVIGSYCSFTPGGNYNTISGTTIFDVDNNGCGTGADIFEGLMKVKINDGTINGYTFTNNLSQYKFFTQAGNFTITPEFENNWFTASPASATVTFANNNNNTSTNNFCITSAGSHPDVEVVVYPISNAQPGFNAHYKVVYKNKGNQTLSGAVTFTYNDTVLDFESATPAQSASATGQLTFNYTNLLPFEDRSIIITLNLNGSTEVPPLNNGDNLNFSVAITPATGDETPADNTFQINQVVTGSYDPNDIVCLEGDFAPPSAIGSFLHYVVNFENTGTAPATFVVVKHNINPADFDISSLQLMNSSHSMYTRLNGNTIEFIFETINLAAGDHGNILFRIKSKNSLQVGDVVTNNANIFFDYNWPIATNDANTTFQVLSAGDFAKDDSVSVYPNPSTGIVNIKAAGEVKSVQMYDVQGRLLQASQDSVIDVSERAAGIYFLKIATDKGVKVEKIVKQ